MKVRKANTRHSKRKPQKTHEERAVDEIFAEETEGDFTVSLNDVEDLAVHAFEAVDYGLDSEVSRKRWEEAGREIAEQTNNYLLSIAASLDGIKSAEEHLLEHFDMKYNLLDRETLDQVEYALNFKIKALILDRLDLNDDQKKLLLIRFTMKGGHSGSSDNPMDAFRKFLSAAEPEESPYGVGLTKTFKRDQ